jgi:hypothetical protein
MIAVIGQVKVSVGQGQPSNACWNDFSALDVSSRTAFSGREAVALRAILD